MSEIKPWRENIGKPEAYMIMCDVLDVLCEKEAIKKAVYERLKQAPSTEPKTGKWIEESDNYGHSSYFCSRCGTQEGEPSGFCPNCGADMRGADDE